ncbi:MAG: C39 family peptidase [Candidatus Thorarchaeota archaeon]
MKVNSSYKTAALAVIICLTALQLTTPAIAPDIVTTDHVHSPAIEGYGHISGVPYQWQEINGFCHWSALSMALQYAGAPLDLRNLFAASGIGFSAGYIRYEELAVFLPGAALRQMEPLPTLADLYGLDIDIYYDDDSGFGSFYGPAMDAWGLNYTDTNGWTDTINLIRTTIDEGYPIVVWTDPYYLPAIDYDIARDLGLQSEDTGSGHAVLLVGYNDTAGTAEVMDPGVGAFGEYFGFPDDGRWHYEVDYISLKHAMNPIGYGCIVVRPNTGPPEDFVSRLASYICERLRGDRASYGEGLENIFFANFGADSFRGLAYDLTPDEIAAYLDDFSSNVEERYYGLIGIGMQMEGMLALQYLSFREGLKALPGILSDLDLDEFLERGLEALPHFEVLSDNSSLIEIGYSGNATIVTETFSRVAEAYRESGDLNAALADSDEELSEIRGHLIAIADLWNAAASSLESALLGAIELPHSMITSAGAIVVISLAVLARRRRSG